MGGGKDNEESSGRSLGYGKSRKGKKRAYGRGWKRGGEYREVGEGRGARN